jgi:hypothetical protein
LNVKVGAKAEHFVEFCEEQAACPFTVVVFTSDLKRRHYSAGRLRPTKKPKKNKARPAATATLAR